MSVREPAGGSGDAAREVASVARVLAAAGLVEGFGHVSARLPGGGFAITSTGPLYISRPGDIRRIDAPGSPPQATPLEAPLHAAIYAARPDVGAVCRTHSRAAVAWGARGRTPPLLHGLGLLAGRVECCDGTDLIAGEEAARPAAAALAGADCLLIRANGAVATGASLAETAVRAYFLEERCRVALDAGESARELSATEREQRSRWLAAELPRAWTWLSGRFRNAGTGQGSLSGEPGLRWQHENDEEEEEAHAQGRI